MRVTGLVLLLCSLTCVCQSQQSMSKAVPDQGTFANNTYSNAFFGLSYKLPETGGWFVNTEIMQQDAARANKLAGRFLLTVLDRHTGGRMRERVLIMADESSLYHPPLDLRTYVEKVTSAQAKLGSDVAGGVRVLSCDGIHGSELYSGDFTEEYPGGKLYKSFVATEVGGYFISFTFASGSPGALNELVDSLSQLAFGIATRPQAKNAPTTIPSKRVRISEMVLQGFIIWRPVPSYPEDAQRASVEGPVVLRVILSETGELMKAQVISGDPLLRDAALGALRYWKFKPYTLNGSPVQVESQITIDFKLGKGRRP